MWGEFEEGSYTPLLSRYTWYVIVLHDGESLRRDCCACLCAQDNMIVRYNVGGSLRRVWQVDCAWAFICRTSRLQDIVELKLLVL